MIRPSHIFLTALIAVLQSCAARAQFLDSYQNPPGIDWKVIDTPGFEIIYPREIERDAQRVANTLEHALGPVSKTLGQKPDRITLLLSNRTTTANGYVTLAPRYSEWFCTPPPYALLGTGEWFNLLAAHETRHVAQFDKLNDGFTLVMYYLFGESAWGFLSFWSVPGWAWEGDATGVETALSLSGRGRMPDFDRALRTIELSGGRYSYYKAYLGSFADAPVDMYALGYLLTTHMRRNHGADAFSRILRRSTNWSFLPWSFSLMSNSEIDKTAAGIYNAALDELRPLWLKQLEDLKITEGTDLNRARKKCWTNYRFPRYLSDSSIVALKWGLDDIFTLVRLRRDGGEEELCTAALYDDPFDARGHLVVWHEQEAALRWGKSDANAIRRLDVRDGKKRTLASGTRYFSPALSPDLKSLAVVEFTADRKCALVILDAESGVERARIPNPGNDFIQTPSWTDDGKGIVAMRILEKGGKAPTLYDADGGRRRDLLPVSNEDVSLPAVRGKYVLYGSPVSGIDNIYALDMVTGRRYQAVSSRFGAYHPAISPDGSSLAFSNYTPEGFSITEIPFDTASWIPLDRIENKSIGYYEPLIMQESGGDIFADVPARSYESRDYSALGNLINIHSWGLSPESDDNSVKLSLTSRNVMNTFGAAVGFDFNWNEMNGAVMAGVSYAGLYPIMSAGGSYGMRTSSYTAEDGGRKPYTWNEKSARFGLRVPLNLTSGLYQAYLTFGAEIARTQVSNKTAHFADEVNDGALTPLSWSVDLAAGYGWIRDFNPRWGQFFSAVYRHTPFAADRYNGDLFSMRADLYFPGAFSAHSLSVQGAAEWGNPTGYRFASEILFPRGYGERRHELLLKGGVNYAFPLWYPDLHIWSLLNFQRLRVNLFYDHGEAYDNGPRSRYRSAGFELIVDYNLFSLPALLNTGLRGSYLFDEKRWVWTTVIFF